MWRIVQQSSGRAWRLQIGQPSRAGWRIVDATDRRADHDDVRETPRLAMRRHRRGEIDVTPPAATTITGSRSPRMAWAISAGPAVVTSGITTAPSRQSAANHLDAGGVGRRLDHDRITGRDAERPEPTRRDIDALGEHSAT